MRRIDAIFDVERAMNAAAAEARHATRPQEGATLVLDPAWMRGERARLSRHARGAKAIDHMSKRRGGFARFLEEGRIGLTKNAAERELRGIALGRKTWLFVGNGDVLRRRDRNGGDHRSFGPGCRRRLTATSWSRPE